MLEDRFVVIKGPVTWSDCGVSVPASSRTTGGLLKRWGAAEQLSRLAAAHLQQDPGGHQSSVAKDRQANWTGGAYRQKHRVARPRSEAAGERVSRSNNSSSSRRRLASPFSRAKLSCSAGGLTQNGYVHFRTCLGLACSTVAGGGKKKHASMLHVVTQVRGDLDNPPARPVPEPRRLYRYALRSGRDASAKKESWLMISSGAAGSHGDFPTAGRGYRSLGSTTADRPCPLTRRQIQGQEEK